MNNYDITSLTMMKNQYSDLRDYLNSILKYLNKCIDELEMASNSVRNYYLIDNISYKVSEINAKRDYLVKIRNDLVNIVIPQLDQKVTNLSQ